jgi:hypothetical protein
VLVRTFSQNKAVDFNAVQRRAAKSVARIAARFFFPKFQRQHMHPTRIFEKKEGSFSLGHTVVAGRGYAAFFHTPPYRHPADRFFSEN